MKKYIRVCNCCGNTFETDTPEFVFIEGGIKIHLKEIYSTCKPCRKIKKEEYLKKARNGILLRLKLPRPQG